MTPKKEKAIFNWSGGKDSALALYTVLQDNELDVKYLLTSTSQETQRITMHGVRNELLHLQAESIHIPLYKMELPENPDMNAYNQIAKETMQSFANNDIHTAVFGDIFLEDLRQYREKQLSAIHIKSIFPLWQKDTHQLLNDFIDLGFKAIIVCVDEKHLDPSFTGRLIDRDFIRDLPAQVDPCGENGEYHSFVFDGPIFSQPVSFKKGETVYKKYPKVAENKSDECFTEPSKEHNTGFYYCDLLPIFS